MIRLLLTACALGWAASQIAWAPHAGAVAFGACIIGAVVYDILYYKEG